MIPEPPSSVGALQFTVRLPAAVAAAPAVTEVMVGAVFGAVAPFT